MKMIKKNVGWVALFAVLAALPLFLTGNYIVSILTYCLAYASFGSAWNLIGGYGGQISWCHSSFVAIGAYTGYLGMKYFEISPWITLIIGVAISVAFATLIGYGTFKLTGAYFSLATMAFSELVRYLLLYFKDYTGGAAGIYLPYRGSSIAILSFDNDYPFYYLLLVALIIVICVVKIFESTKTGNYLRVIRENETAALSLGIETFKVKLKAFQLSAIITSIVGMIFGFFLGFVEPLSVCGNEMAVRIGLVAIIGGLGTSVGPVIGAFIVVPLIEAAGVLFGSRGGSQILYGLGIVLIVLFMPDGLIQIFLKRRRSKKNDHLAEAK